MGRHLAVLMVVAVAVVEASAPAAETAKKPPDEKSKGLELAPLVESKRAQNVAQATSAPVRAGGGRRTVTAGSGAGGTVPLINVAKGRTTTLMFESPIRTADLLDVGRIFAPPRSSPASKALYLTTLRDPGSVVTTLLVVMADGAELPFQLVGTKEKDADVVVDVAVPKPVGESSSAGAASPPAEESNSCRASAAQLHQELDECRASTAPDALKKIAQLILAEDAQADSKSVVFEGRGGLRAIDKQNRLLVEATGFYRFFGTTYLLLTVENRHPDRTWVLDRAQIRLTGAGAELPVLSTITQLEVLPAGEIEKVVVMFATPIKRSKSSLAVTLLEKRGNRNVTLDGIEL